MVPGIVDLRIQQMFNEPSLHIHLDRTKAEEIGFSAKDVAQSLLISLSGSFQTAPTFWLDPRNGVSYNISTQTPEYRSDSLQKLENIPVTGPGTTQSGILADLASFSRGSEMAVVSHYNVEPVIDIFGSVDGRDLGGVARDITPILNRNRKDLPRGSQINILGQIDTMNQSFVGVVVRPRILDPARLPADRREFPIVARSVHHPNGLAGGTGRNRVVPVRHGNDDQRPRVDRRDHVHRRGDGQ